MNLETLKNICWSFIGLLFFVICIFVTLYCGGYIYLFGSILEFMLGNFLQGFVRLLCAGMLSWGIWEPTKGLCGAGLIYFWIKSA